VDESTHPDPALCQVAEATKSSVRYARLSFKHSLMATSVLFCNKVDTKRRVESLNTAVLTESLHFKSVYK